MYDINNWHDVLYTDPGELRELYIQLPTKAGLANNQDPKRPSHSLVETLGGVILYQD